MWGGATSQGAPRGARSAWESAQPKRRHTGIWLDPTYREMAMRTLRKVAERRAMSSKFAVHRKSPYFAHTASSTPRDSMPTSNASSAPPPPSVRTPHWGEGSSSSTSKNRRSNDDDQSFHADTQSQNEHKEEHNSFKRRFFRRAKKYSQPASSRASAPPPVEERAWPTEPAPAGSGQSLTDRIRVLLAKDDKVAKVSLLTELRHIAEGAKAERRSRFRALQRIVHPDKWPAEIRPDATKLFQLVQEHSAAVDGVVPAIIHAWG